jgi:glucoamylase
MDAVLNAMTTARSFAIRTTASILALVATALVAGHSAQAGDFTSWLQTQTSHSAAVMLGNVGPSSAFPQAAPGAVLASASTEPDYRFHWIRDGALTMSTVLGLYERSNNPDDQARLLKLLMDYADFSRRNQLTRNLSGEADGAGVGDPKFNLDGSAWLQPWGRPQNDGPALRASTLIRFANLLIDHGHADWVRQKLYDSGLPATTVIKVDLEFVSRHWRDGSFDLWEEVRGKHFYTRMAQRRALIEGAALADRLGDAAAAQWYRSQVSALEPEIARHWDSGRGMILATLERTDGLDYKASGLDVAVILGVLHGAVPGSTGDSFFTVNDDRVLATAERIQDSFRHLYTINNRGVDQDGLFMGTAIGRYPEDRYSGSDSLRIGSPWFLATHAFAELYYRAAARWESQGRVHITAVNSALFNRLGAFASRSVPGLGETLGAGDPRFAQAMQALRRAGDEFLRRTRFHGDGRGGLSEQFNRDSGFMQSAGDLTWSHASLLTAVWARGY